MTAGAARVSPGRTARRAPLLLTLPALAAAAAVLLLIATGARSAGF